MAQYNPLDREKIWQDFWQENHIYEFDPTSSKKVYSVDTPPPTVSGKLHMGHVFSYTQTEVLARYHRLAGDNVYYPFGMDDNGLPTEKLIETDLGVKANTMPRQEFIKKCQEIVPTYRQKYRALWQSLGFSVDWRLEYSTISDQVVALTHANFKDLYQRGAIYRQKAPALWCPLCQTSVAQAEVEDVQKDSVFYHIIFKDDLNQDIIVATTRPELLPACVGAFVNPEDKRYQHLINKTITTPLGATVPVYADPRAQIDKGTGIVMCCTYGDETDLAWKKEFNLEEKIILDRAGKFNDQCSLESMRGLFVTKGREVIIDHLRDNNQIVKEIPIVHDVGCHERCGTPIEIINNYQWFVKVLDIKQQLLDLANQINWYPKSMKARFDAWVNNLKWDWCISRDRFYGPVIPAYVDPDSDRSSLEPGDGLVPENLVYDTWFTSGNTPEINAKLNLDITKGKIAIPMSLRPNAHDIIRTWDFYTIVLAYYKYNSIPWTDVAVAGHILLRKGEKISKRTGGGNLRPEEQVAQYGADVIRYAMCGAALGVDGYYDVKELENGRKLVNKLYNASNFAIRALEGYTVSEFDFSKLEAFDRWIISESQATADKMAKSFDKYDHSHAREYFLKFFWEYFCDNYLEIIKKRVYDLPVGDPAKLSAQTALYITLRNILVMATPFTPHITEEIYQTYFKSAGLGMPLSINQLSWPVEKYLFSDKLSSTAQELLKVISLVRAQKTKSGLALAAEVNQLLINHPSLQSADIEQFEFDLKAVTRSTQLIISHSDLLEVQLK